MILFSGMKWLFKTNTGKRFSILKLQNQRKSSWLFSVHHHVKYPAVQAYLGDCAHRSWKPPLGRCHRRHRRHCQFCGQVVWFDNFISGWMKFIESPNYSTVFCGQFLRGVLFICRMIWSSLCPTFANTYALLIWPLCTGKYLCKFWMAFMHRKILMPLCTGEREEALQSGAGTNLRL